MLERILALRLGSEGAGNNTVSTLGYFLGLDLVGLLHGYITPCLYQLCV